jgi:hypothetical protein
MVTVAVLVCGHPPQMREPLVNEAIRQENDAGTPLTSIEDWPEEAMR